MEEGEDEGKTKSERERVLIQKVKTSERKEKKL